MPVDVSMYYISNDECLDDHENILRDTGIVLPDGRELWAVNDRDLLRLPDGTFEEFDPVTDLPWEEKIDRIRKVVETKSYAVIEGVAVDLFSASYIIKLFDNLHEVKHKLKFLSLPIPRMAEVAFKCLS